VRLGRAKHQNPAQAELPLNLEGETIERQRSGEARSVENGNARSGTNNLMEEVIGRDNVEQALKRVRKNQGSPGIDGMSVDELPSYLAKHWEDLREQLLAGAYEPRPVRRQQIPKPGGGIRELGIPTVLDRVIQQAILQVLQPRFDPTFSEHSYGFRPGRSARDAVRAAQKYIQEGRGWVVDIDLEKFFDRVNHDMLMGRLAKRIEDKRMLKLIRRYLEAGIMVNGVVMEREEGTPQGGPLSPLLANVLLDDIDKELERRGHAFCRYADDCNVYVQTERAGQRVMEGMRKLFGKLRLKVNESKSAVAPATGDRKFLGYSFWLTKEGLVKRGVAKKALDKMKDRVRSMTKRPGGKSMRSVFEELGAYLRGWRSYFQDADTPRVFAKLDGWIRRRLRAIQLKQWKRGRKAMQGLLARGVSADQASIVSALQHRFWRMAKHPGMNLAFPNTYYQQMGVPRLAP
jgi:group II intron reverse transcriptase/maturase